MKYQVLIGILSLTSVVAFAQTVSARISGTVTDETGAVPGRSLVVSCVFSTPAQPRHKSEQ
jgi:hypothetical protein